MPLLSICIPTYNRSALLKYCLENIRELDKYDISYEVVICDHASPDNTPEVMEWAKNKWDNVRTYRHTKRIEIQQAIYSPMRLAKGKYTVYLADDDKVLCDKLAEYVRFMEDNPGCSVTYSPWWAYDDDKEEIIHGYFEVPELQRFNISDPLKLYNFLTNQIIFPEMAVYRTDCLHKVLLYFNDAAVNIFQVAYGLLKQGEVTFQTDPFYLEVATVKSEFDQSERMNIEVNLSGLDRTRASLEITLERILMDLGANKVPDDMRANAHEILLNYSRNRLVVAFKRCLHKKNYLLASECAQRVILWYGLFMDDLRDIAAQIYLPTGIQAVVSQYQGITWLKTMFVYGFNKPEDVIEYVKTCDPAIDVRAADLETILSYSEPELVFIVVKTDEDKEAFRESNLLSGNVVSLIEWAEYYKILPGTCDIEHL